MSIPPKHDPKALDFRNNQSSFSLAEFNDTSQQTGNISNHATKSTEGSPQSAARYRVTAWGLLGGYGHVITVKGGRKLQCAVGGCTRIFSSTRSSTSGFNYHLTSVHGIKKPPAATKAINSLVAKGPAVDLKDYPLYLAKSVERCVLMDDIPLRALNSSAFQRMLASAYFAPSSDSFVLPSAEKVQAITLANYQKYLPHVKALLKGQTSIALDLGFWHSADQGSMMGVVAHFIDSSWACQSIVIGMELIGASPSAAAKALLAVTDAMEITSKLSSIVAPPSEFMLKLRDALAQEALTHGSFEFEPNQHIPCFAHVAGATCEAAIINGLGAPPWDVGRYEDVVNQCPELCSNLPANILLNRIRVSIVSLRSTAFEAHLVNQPILDTPHRWDSTYRMLEWFCSVHRQLDASRGFSAEDVQMAEQIATFLKLFEEFSHAIAPDKTLTLAMALYYFGILADKLLPHPADADCIPAAKAAARQELVKYFPQRIDPLFVCAMAMDPRHKLQFLESSRRDAIDADDSRRLLVNEWKSKYKPAATSNPEPPRSLFEFSNTRLANPVDELESYLAAAILPCSDGSSNRAVLKFWHSQEKALPSLGRMAKKYLTPPIRSAAAECIFAPLKPHPLNSAPRPEFEAMRVRALLKSWYAHFNLE